MKKLFLTGYCILAFLCSHAAIITVTSTADAGAGSLRNAIASATAGDEIQFSITTPDSIVLSSTLTIAKNLTITGPGPDMLKITAGTNSARSGLVSIQSGFQVNISGLTFSGATTGPGIKNTGSILVLENCRLSKNMQGLYNGGIVIPSNTSKASLNNCEVINNVGSGGIYNAGAGVDSSILVLNYCLVKGNIKTRGFAGAGIQNTNLDGLNFTSGFGFCYISNSAIVENSMPINGAVGGGIASFSDGPANGSTLLIDIRNSTISGNSCGLPGYTDNSAGGGIATYIVNNTDEVNMLRMSHCTIANNYVFGRSRFNAIGLELGSNVLGVRGSILEMNHSIIAGNISSDIVGLDVPDTFIAKESDNNLIGIGARIPGPLLPYVGTTGVPLEVKLCPLAMNGGITPTHALAGGSPAIDAATSTTYITDQRDSARIGLPDIGAFEYNPAVVSTHTVSGTVTQSNGNPLPNTAVFLISFDTSDSSLTEVATTMTDAAGTYSFQATSPREYFVKAAPDSANYPMEIPTYYDSALVFQEAKGVVLCENIQVNFQTILGANPGGPGFLGGKITDGANKKTGESLEGIRIMLIDSSTQKVAAYGDTDINGNFIFPNMALGSYEVWVDRPFINNALAPTFRLTTQDPVLKKLKFELQSTKLEWVGVVEGIDPTNFWEENSYSLYPNPAQESIKFKWEAHTFGEAVLIRLYDPMGRIIETVSTLEPGEITISLSGLSSGVYMYSVSHRNEVKAVGKFMKR